MSLGPATPPRNVSEAPRVLDNLWILLETCHMLPVCQQVKMLLFAQVFHLAFLEEIWVLEELWHFHQVAFDWSNKSDRYLWSKCLRSWFAFPVKGYSNHWQIPVPMKRHQTNERINTSANLGPRPLQVLTWIVANARGQPENEVYQAKL